jgi:hypothetical protein
MSIIIKNINRFFYNSIFNYIPEGDVVIRLTYFPNTPPLPSPSPSPSLNFEVFF